MARKLKSDRLLYLAILALVGGGVVMVYSASAMLAMEWYRQSNLFLFKQATWAVLGVSVLAAVTRVDYHRYQQPAVIWSALGLAVFGLVAVLFRTPIHGTARWFSVAGIGVQPSEFAKLAGILFTAALLDRRMHRIDDLSYSLTPVALAIGGMVVLILLEPDFGTAVTLVVIVGAMVFAAGLSRRYLLLLMGTVVPILAGAMIAAPYRLRRILTFLHPWDDPLGDGFQIIQSLIAVGTGGTTGRGLMNGVQKLFYLPEPHTDFIYAVISEELGLIGATVVLVIFVIVGWRGYQIAAHAPDRFGALLASGLTTMIVAQAFVNMSVVLSLLPTKGIPLPFVSAGGSSMLISLFGMGVLLNVSQHVLDT